MSPSQCTKAQNVHWISHTNKELYGKLPPLSDQINSRRFQLAGHYVIPFRAQHTATWIMG